MRVLPLCLLVLVAAAPAPREKPPTLDELRQVVARLTREVDRLKAQVAELEKKVARVAPPPEPGTLQDRIAKAMADDRVIVGMTEAQVNEIIGRFDKRGTISGQDFKTREFVRDGKTVKRKEFWVKSAEWSSGATIILEDGVVVETRYD